MLDFSWFTDLGDNRTVEILGRMEALAHFTKILPSNTQLTGEN